MERVSQNRMRECCPCLFPFFPNSCNGEFGNVADVGSNRRTNYGIERNAMAASETES